MSKLIHSSGVELSWKEYGEGPADWYVLVPRVGGYYLGEAYISGRWLASNVVSGQLEVLNDNYAVGGDIEAAKAAAENCLLDNGIVTHVNQLPTAGAYTFHFRADRGGATVVATVVRGPDTTVLYGVSFCSPRDSFDKNFGRRLAAFRLIDKPSTLVLPGLVGPREIKAAILAALVIPPGNRLATRIP